MSDIDQIIDVNGVVRRLGMLLPPTGFVSSMPVFEDTIPVWSDVDITSAINAPQRRLGRKLFGPEWTHDQGSVGSCNGWAAAGGYARARYLRGFADGMQFSGSWVYSLINGGRDNGSALEDGLTIGMTEGFAELSLVPPNEIYPQLQCNRRAAQESAAKHKSFRAYAVKSKQGFRSALAMGFPVIVAVSAGSRFQQLLNGVSGVDAGNGNHAVLCDDITIKDGIEVYDHQNSWGTQYGQQGRSYLTWQHLSQPWNYHTAYAIASTQEADG